MVDTPLYVVQCHTRIKCDHAGLGSDGHYNPGDYVSSNGIPVQNMHHAHIYSSREEHVTFSDQFPFELGVGENSTLADYFQPVKVALLIVK